MTPSLRRLRFIVASLAVIIAICGGALAPWFWSGPRPEGVPYGVKYIPGTPTFGLQDFAFQVNYLEQFRYRAAAHPYRLEDQEAIFRNWYSDNARAFPHAYSPVALVVASPLLTMRVETAFLLWTTLNAALLLVLMWRYLLPRMSNATQGAAVAAVLLSYLPVALFSMGQTALATTCLCAAGYLLLRAREGKPSSFARDLLLAATLYVLAIKPSIFLIVFALAIGERAWRPVLISIAGLLITWLALGPVYGGYVDGLKDYNFLLSHYCNADMTSLFRDCMNPEISTNFTSFITALNPDWNRSAFHLSQILFEGLTTLLLVLRWTGRISLSTQFQGLLWTFLLFCPFTLVTEDFLLLLLAVEGTFFRNGAAGAIKVACVWGASNIWLGTLLGFPLAFALKAVLAGWWMIEKSVVRKNRISCRGKNMPPQKPELSVREWSLGARDCRNLNQK